MKVQVVDLKSGNFKKDFTDSLKNTGFAVIVNHGIPFSLIRKTQNQWREFFLSSEEYKNTYKHFNA
jgi:isopenicillin N synthase-like dioxygenase